jgi:hypothetical protein
MPQALPQECPSPSPSPSSNEEIKTIGAAAPLVVIERRQANLEAIEEQLEAEVAAAQATAKEAKFDPRKALLDEGLSEQGAADFLQVRKAKKAPLTQTALDGLKREAEKAGIPFASALALCCERGWQGFKAEWLAPRPNATVPNRNGKPDMMRVAHLDHSSTEAAMAASQRRMMPGADLANLDDLQDF